MIVLALIFFLAPSLIQTTCPSKDVLLPCTCKSDKIHCLGHEKLDLLKIFNALRASHTKVQNHFKELLLTNSQLTEIKENTFKGFNFGTVNIKNCTKLKTIHKNAFNETDHSASYIAIRDNPALSSPDGAIFHELSKFKNVGWIDFGDNNISEIPSNAFNNVGGYQKRLTGIGLFGKSIKHIGEHPFYHLNALVLLQFLDTSLATIPAKVFSMEQKSNQSFTLRFLGGKFQDNYNISTEAFLSIHRPTEIMIDRKAYLDEHVFLPFLLENKLNSIQSNYDLPFDCQDCRNYWIKKNKLEKQIKNLKCSNKKLFDDPANFAKCSS